MATEISNGSQTVKLYQSVNRGKAMYQLAYYMGGRRVQKNFADKAEAKRILSGFVFMDQPTLLKSARKMTPLCNGQDYSISTALDAGTDRRSAHVSTHPLARPASRKEVCPIRRARKCQRDFTASP